MNNNIELFLKINKSGYSYTIHDIVTFKIYDHVRISGHDFAHLYQTIDNIQILEIKVLWNISEVMLMPSATFDYNNVFQYMHQANMLDLNIRQRILYDRVEGSDIYALWCVDADVYDDLNARLKILLASNIQSQHIHPLMSMSRMDSSVSSSMLGISDMIWINIIDHIAHIKIYGHGAQLIVAESIEFESFDDILYAIKILSMADDVFFNYRIMINGDMAEDCARVIGNYYPRVSFS